MDTLNNEYRYDFIFNTDNIQWKKKHISRYPNDTEDGVESIAYYGFSGNMYDLSSYNFSPVFRTLSLTNAKSAFYYRGNGLKFPLHTFMPGCYGYHKQTNALKRKIESSIFKDISHKMTCDNIIL